MPIVIFLIGRISHSKHLKFQGLKRYIPGVTTMTTPNINIPRETIAQFCRKWKIREFAFFGSVLRDDFRPDSDIDVLVTFS